MKQCKICGTEISSSKTYCISCRIARRKFQQQEVLNKIKNERDKNRKLLEHKCNIIPKSIDKWYYSANWLQNLTGYNRTQLTNRLLRLPVATKYQSHYIKSINGYVGIKNLAFYDIRNIYKNIKTTKPTIAKLLKKEIDATNKI